MFKFKQLVIGVFFFFGIVALSYSAQVFWDSEQLALKVKGSELRVTSLEFLNSFANFSHDPLSEALFKASNEVGADSELMLEVANKYTKIRPLDSNGWLWASLFAQRENDIALAKKYLNISHRLSINNTPQLIKVFNRYLEMNLVNEAIPVAHDLSYTRPQEFRKSFYIMSRLNSNYEEIVDLVIPKSVPNIAGRKVYPQDWYYDLALTDALRAKNDSLAAAIWKAIPVENKRHSKYGLNYLNYLSLRQNRSELDTVWADHVGEPLLVGEFPKQSIESDNMPCWQNNNKNQESVVVEGLEEFDDVAFMLTFSGTENVDYRDLTCIISVESGREYTLFAQWLGEEITTLSGPYIEIFAPGIKTNEFYAKNDFMIGSWFWSDVELNFKVPDGTEIINVRIRRKKTDFLDSKISGQVGFRNFALTEIDDTNNDLLTPQ